MLGELAGSQEKARGAVPQHIVIVHFLAAQLRHGHGVAFRRRRLAVAQQLAGILALLVGTAEILAEAARLQLHLTAALIAFDHRPLVPLQAEIPDLQLVAGTVGVVAADMELAVVVEKITVHGGAAQLAAVLVE